MHDFRFYGMELKGDISQKSIYPLLSGIDPMRLFL
jgi:hypothetical protein